MTSNIYNNYTSIHKGNFYLILKENLPAEIEKECYGILHQGSYKDVQTFSLGRNGVFISSMDGNNKFLLKIYTHGGFWGNVGCKYLFFRNRSLIEFELYLNHLKDRLPVPECVGVFWTRKHLFYKCGIITQYISDSYNLEELLIADSISDNEKQHFASQIGAVIKRMHDSGIFHRDLQLRNILIVPKTDSIFLIDFDKAIWKRKVNNFYRSLNLIRLKRSFIKRNIPLKFYNFVMMGYKDIKLSVLATFLSLPHLAWIRFKNTLNTFNIV